MVSNKVDLAISLGTSETVILIREEGIVLKEPTLAMRGAGNLLFGIEAKKNLGKLGNTSSFISPVENGKITDEELATQMLKYFLNKVVVKGLFGKNIKALFLIPCGLTLEQKSAFKNVAYGAGISEVVFVANVLCVKLGYNAINMGADACVVCDIGAGKTDIAIVNNNTIVGGATLNFGGQAMDYAIMSYIERSLGLKISMQASEKLKLSVGSLYNNDKASIEINGSSVYNKLAQAEIIEASDIKNAIEDYYIEIVKQIENLLKNAGSDLMSMIVHSGVMFAGGAANIAGLDSLIKTKLSMPVTIAEDCENIALLGAGSLLNDKSLLHHIITTN